jgi:CRISPR-associated exonuclease Cas4
MKEPSTDESLVMISALQHYLFCPRQCALIHVEGVWSENYLTAAGRVMHERVDGKVRETRRDIHLATSLRLVSNRLGVMGVADMVEFHKLDAPKDVEGRIIGAVLPGRKGFWRPFPVEYKRGAPKSHQADEVQLCAQAMCLEEMLGVSVKEGALYYGEMRRRTAVAFDDVLRKLTEDTARGVHELLSSHKTPEACWTKGCRACSLLDVCRPEDFSARDSVRKWMKNQMETAGI